MRLLAVEICRGAAHPSLGVHLVAFAAAIVLGGRQRLLCQYWSGWGPGLAGSGVLLNWRKGLHNQSMAADVSCLLQENVQHILVRQAPALRAAPQKKSGQVEAKESETLYLKKWHD